MNSLLVSYIFIAFIMLIVWCLTWYLRNPTVVDVAWAFSITVISLIYLYPYSNEVHFIYALIITVWGLRLGFYLYYTRLKKGIRDKRYMVLSHQWQRPWLFYLLNFQLQGVFIFVLTLSVYLLASAPRLTLSWLDSILALMAILAIIFETIADEQLLHFSRYFPGQLCQIGLWQYSRHPNYFFEWLFWLVIAMVAFAKSQHPLSYCAPCLLYVVMNYLTIPITESGSEKSKGDEYLQYQKQVNQFFPWWPRASTNR